MSSPVVVHATKATGKARYGSSSSSASASASASGSDSDDGESVAVGGGETMAASGGAGGQGLGMGIVSSAAGQGCSSPSSPSSPSVALGESPAGVPGVDGGAGGGRKGKKGSWKKGLGLGLAGLATPLNTSMGSESQYDSIESPQIQVINLAASLSSLDSCSNSPAVGSPGSGRSAPKRPARRSLVKKRGGSGGLGKKRGRLGLTLAVEPGPSDSGTDGVFDINTYGGELLNASRGERDPMLSLVHDLQLKDLELVCELGEGAQGAVSKMCHKETGLLLACKVIRLDTAATPDAERKREELFTEVRTYAQSNCPYVVNSLGCWREDDLITIALEYMDCGSLESVLQSAGALSEDVIRHIAWQGANALHYLHNTRHLIHRDLKPANILLSSEGLAKISDFGTSRELAQTLAKASTFVGTFTYMSPERINSTEAKDGYTSACDVWAFGLILVECALGKYPYEFNEDEVFKHMTCVCEQDAPIDEWLPAETWSAPFREFVAACLARDPNDRPSAGELCEHEWLAGTTEMPFDFGAWLRETVTFVQVADESK
ncbi:STE/STE7 protein kinase [Thecamonas trahens ATCC 50062]|uniref:mitogen-activated protein kinase kinase n=1 Tax=Thecamonas trahens ATCC 50062 TaxID=461836 RepID=A0A0L0D279_THETB|nr:STE/STE7 protein kinase [Thecamonas trahens ATCC 50062]KNC46230.1 STE/STE7 protein kinase [Thecamonas trahens ATCC 50062]|eukprot:XP_013760527.1 STE/STE7 protein kinase [Thecamonas trahens ATCC 50062]